MPDLLDLDLPGAPPTLYFSDRRYIFPIGSAPPTTECSGAIRAQTDVPGLAAPGPEGTGMELFERCAATLLASEHGTDERTRAPGPSCRPRSTASSPGRQAGQAGQSTGERGSALLGRPPWVAGRRADDAGLTRSLTDSSRPWPHWQPRGPESRPRCGIASQGVSRETVTPLTNHQIWSTIPMVAPPPPVLS